MSLWLEIKTIYPELTDEDFSYRRGKILLQNDGDEAGDYILKWEYEKSIPQGLKLGK